MATLQVRNLPDDLHTELAARSRDQGISMSEYVTRLLRGDLSRTTVEQWFAAYPSRHSTRTVDVTTALDQVRGEYADDGDAARQPA